MLKSLIPRALSARALSDSVGRFADVRLPRPMLHRLIRVYARLYGVDLTESAGEVETFSTFNAFFTRALRPGARTLPDDATAFVSPCDGLVTACETIGPSARITQVKGRDYALGDLLADEALAQRLSGGLATTIYLSPRDYHRVHSPVSGELVEVCYVPGRRYPVDRRAREAVPNLYAVNERMIFVLETARYGVVVLVMVGAANVSRITCSVTEHPISSRGITRVRHQNLSLQLGDELARFNLGSTVVLLAEKTPSPWRHEIGATTRMGELAL